MLDVAARLPAARQRQTQLRQQHPTVMGRRPLARRRQRSRQLSRQSDPVRETAQHEQPHTRHDPVPARCRHRIRHASMLHLGDAFLVCTLCALTTRIVAGQKGFSADA